MVAIFTTAVLLYARSSIKDLEIDVANTRGSQQYESIEDIKQWRRNSIYQLSDVIMHLKNLQEQFSHDSGFDDHEYQDLSQPSPSSSIRSQPLAWQLDMTNPSNSRITRLESESSGIGSVESIGDGCSSIYMIPSSSGEDSGQCPKISHANVPLPPLPIAAMDEARVYRGSYLELMNW